MKPAHRGPVAKLASKALDRGQGSNRHSRLEGIARRVVVEEFSGREVEIPAMQMNRSGLHALSDPRIGQQVFERNQDARLLAGAVLQRWRLRWQFGTHARACALGDADPLADELAPGIETLHQRMNAAALGVPEDDDVLNLQRQDGELQRRRHTREVTAGMIGWHQVGDVAHDKNIAGSTRESAHATINALGLWPSWSCSNNSRSSPKYFS